MATAQRRAPPSPPPANLQAEVDRTLGKPRKKKAPCCPTCGAQPKVRHTAFGWRRDCCGLWAWGTHAPLVDAATHAARQYAHQVFDSLWQSGLIGRSEAYAALAQELDIRPEDCHMKLMDHATASRVPAATAAISKRLRGAA